MDHFESDAARLELGWHAAPPQVFPLPVDIVMAWVNSLTSSKR
jgi:hypothetical protein